MALPKKKSRSITVNGRAYLWMVRAVGSHLSLTVQDPKTKELHQRRVRANTGEVDDFGDRTILASVTPADVKEFILYRFPQP